MAPTFGARNYTSAAPASSTNGTVAIGALTVVGLDLTGWPASNAFFVMDEGLSTEEIAFYATRTTNTLTGVLRGECNTTAAAHASGASMKHVYTSQDAAEANTVTSLLTTAGDLPYRAAAGWSRLAVGANGLAMVVDTALGGKLKWGQVGTAGIADASITAVKLAAGYRSTYVAVAASPPASPTEGDQWYQTDTDKFLIYTTATTGWVQPWNMPWGEVAYAESQTAAASIGSTYTDTGNTLTFTAVANRKYRIGCNARIVQSTAGGIIDIRLVNSGATVTYAASGMSLSTGEWGHFHFAGRVTGIASGSLTIKLQIKTSAGTVSVQGATTDNIFVEDVGPNGAPA